MGPNKRFVFLLSPTGFIESIPEPEAPEREILWRRVQGNIDNGGAAVFVHADLADPFPYRELSVGPIETLTPEAQSQLAELLDEMEVVLDERQSPEDADRCVVLGTPGETWAHLLARTKEEGARIRLTEMKAIFAMSQMERLERLIGLSL